MVLTLIVVSLSFGCTKSLDEASQSVVVITNGPGWGSGVAIQENLILTAAHVARVEGLYITANGIRYEIISKWIADNNDVAFLKINGKLSPLKLGSISKLRIGSKVYLISTPCSMIFEKSVTCGIISGFNRVYDKLWHRVLQTDCPGAPGSSGGPVVDEKMRIVGIHVGSIKPYCVMLSIPVDIIREELEKYYESTRK